MRPPTANERQQPKRQEQHAKHESSKVGLHETLMTSQDPWRTSFYHRGQNSCPAAGSRLRADTSQCRRGPCRSSKPPSRIAPAWETRQADADLERWPACLKQLADQAAEYAKIWPTWASPPPARQRSSRQPSLARVALTQPPRKAIDPGDAAPVDTLRPHREPCRRGIDKRMGALPVAPWALHPHPPGSSSAACSAQSRRENASAAQIAVGTFG